MTGWCGGFGRCCVVQEAGETRCAMNMCRSVGEDSEGGQGESQDGTSLYDEAFLLKDAQCLIRHELAPAFAPNPAEDTRESLQCTVQYELHSPLLT
jgi:hypothetical protein